MKTLLITLLLLAVAEPVLSQESPPVPHPQPLRQHEFRIMVGAYPAMSNISTINYNPWFPSTLSEFEATKSYTGSTFTIGGYSASYAFRLHKWVDFGAAITFSHSYFNTYSNLTAAVQNHYFTNCVSIVPMVRFTWLNRPLVRLYSSVGLGIALTSSNRLDIDSSDRVTGQFTPIGICVGRALFGFAEVGYGAQGALIVGLGYSFNGKKTQR